MRISIIILSAALLFTSCLKEGEIFIPLEDTVPENINDGWEISTPSDEGVNEEELIQVYYDIQNNRQPWQLRSLLVFRNNQLIAENYFKDPTDIDTPRPIWSCTKQVMGVLTGIAVDKGVINSLGDPISYYMVSELEEHQDKKDITISHLLTMRSGIGFDEVRDVSALLQRIPDNTADFILGKPLLFTPGEEFNYNSGETHLLAISIQNAVQKRLQDWADDVLFNKIGFTNYTWLDYDGYNFGGYGISTTPRELAKIAHLVLNNGTYGNEQIVSESWIKEMITTQTEIGMDSDYTFGNLWWINESEGIYMMAGSGGQYACIVPAKNLVIVAMSEHDTDDELEIGFDTFLPIVRQVITAAE